MWRGRGDSAGVARTELLNEALVRGMGGVGIVVGWAGIGDDGMDVVGVEGMGGEQELWSTCGTGAMGDAAERGWACWGKAFRVRTDYGRGTDYAVGGLGSRSQRRRMVFLAVYVRIAEMDLTGNDNLFGGCRRCGEQFYITFLWSLLSHNAKLCNFARKRQ